MTYRAHFFTILILTYLIQLPNIQACNLWEFIQDLQAQKVLKKTLTTDQLQIDSIQSLQMDRMQIRSLKGFDHLTGLQELSITHNFIEDVTALAALEKLQRIDASYNRINNPLPLACLPQLEILILSYNNIKHTFGCMFHNLRQLDLSHNQIEQILIVRGHNDLLEFLDLSHNPLTSIQLSSSNLPSLHTLCANNTFIQDVRPFLKCQELENLELQHCCNLSSIAPLFVKCGERYECRLKKLKNLSFSVEFLDTQSKQIVHELQLGNITKPITLNGELIRQSSKKPSKSSPICL